MKSVISLLMIAVMFSSVSISMNEESSEVSQLGEKVTLTNDMLNMTAVPIPESGVNNIIDGDKTSYWTAQNEAYVTVDLGDEAMVSYVGVAFREYTDDRIIPYDVKVSSDGENFEQVWSGTSEAFSGEIKYIEVNKDVRYITFTFYGNSISGWSSVAEIEVYKQ